MPAPERIVSFDLLYTASLLDGVQYAHAGEVVQGPNAAVDAALEEYERPGTLHIQEGERLVIDGEYTSADEQQRQLNTRLNEVSAPVLELQDMALGGTQRISAETLTTYLGYAGALSPADITMLGWQKIQHLAQLPGTPPVVFTHRMRRVVKGFVPELTDHPVSVEMAGQKYTDIRGASPAILLPSQGLPTFRTLGYHTIGDLVSIAAVCKYDTEIIESTLRDVHQPDRASAITGFIMETVLPAVHRFDRERTKRRQADVIAQITEATSSF